MEFTRLRLTGFKSFVDPTDVHIDPGLTGVVGPNGCGKSNIVEALRWVMGENAPRQMRSSEMDEVIFAGTAGRPARNMAEVLLTLDNAARGAPAAYNERAGDQRHAEDRARQRLAVPGQWPRRAGARRADAVRGRGVRRAHHGDRQPGAGRRPRQRQAGGTAPGARRRRRHHRPPRPPSRGRASPARGRNQSGKAGRRHRGAGGAA